MATKEKTRMDREFEYQDGDYRDFRKNKEQMEEKGKGNVTMISIPNLAKAWGCSRDFLWRMAKTGEIPATKIGERWFIPRWWVKKREEIGILSDTTV